MKMTQPVVVVFYTCRASLKKQPQFGELWQVQPTLFHQTHYEQRQPNYEPIKLEESF
jgi:hypothetical protein